MVGAKTGASANSIEYSMFFTHLPQQNCAVKTVRMVHSCSQLYNSVFAFLQD